MNISKIELYKLLNEFSIAEHFITVIFDTTKQAQNDDCIFPAEQAKNGN